MKERVKTKTKTKTKQVTGIGSSKSGWDEREGVAGALLEKVSITPQSRSSLSSSASHKAEWKYIKVSCYALNQYRWFPGFCRYQACSGRTFIKKYWTGFGQAVVSNWAFGHFRGSYFGYTHYPIHWLPERLVHNCTIFLCSLDVGNIDDQCRGPSIREDINRKKTFSFRHCPNEGIFCPPFLPLLSK